MKRPDCSHLDIGGPRTLVAALFMLGLTSLPWSRASASYLVCSPTTIAPESTKRLLAAAARVLPSGLEADASPTICGRRLNADVSTRPRAVTADTTERWSVHCRIGDDWTCDAPAYHEYLTTLIDTIGGATRHVGVNYTDPMTPSVARSLALRMLRSRLAHDPLPQQCLSAPAGYADSVPSGPKSLSGDFFIVIVDLDDHFGLHIGTEQFYYATSSPDLEPAARDPLCLAPWPFGPP